MFNVAKTVADPCEGSVVERAEKSCSSLICCGVINCRVSVQPSTPFIVRTFTKRRRVCRMSTRSPCFKVATIFEDGVTSSRRFREIGPANASPSEGASFGSSLHAVKPQQMPARRSRGTRWETRFWIKAKLTLAISLPSLHQDTFEKG